MTCNECKGQITDWLEVSWEKERPIPSLPDEVENHLDSCSRCKVFFKTAQVLSGEQKYDITPPPFLSTRISARLAEHNETSQLRKEKKLPIWLKKNLNYQAGRYAFFGLTGILLIFILYAVIMQALFSTDKTKVLVHFTFDAPEAKQVMVVGDWNDWQTTAQKLSDPDGDGIWEIKLKIDPGKEYRYQFLIDGRQWLPDPKAVLHIDDGFGGIDSVLQL